jgi:replicative DNA helicase
MGSAARDENDRLLAGTLPENPGDDAVPIPLDSAARQTAERMAKAEGWTGNMPYDLTAEVAILAALIWCGTYAASSQTPTTVIDLLDRADMMTIRAHRAIWAALLDLRKRGAPCEKTAVHSELLRAKAVSDAGGMQYIEDLVAVAVPVTDLKLREYAEAIRETWLRRQLVKVAGQLQHTAVTSKDFAAEVAAKFAMRLNEAAGRGARDASYVHVAVPLSRTMRKAQTPGLDIPLTTGIKRIDDLLLGGLRRRQVTVLGARTSVGKSALALEIAISAHEANPAEAILYVSMEMTEEEFTDRMISSRAKVETRSILKGQCSAAEYDRMLEVARRIRTEEIYFNVKQNLTIPQIRGIATKVSREVTSKGKRLGMVVIDHMGLVRPTERKSSREQEVAETSRELRNVANDFDCHVLALAQIGREAEKQPGKDKMPQLHHLRESGSIEQDTNNVLILHRKRAANGRFVDDEPAKLGVAKARNGELGLVWLAVEPKFVRFSPWEDSEQAKARKPDPNRNPSRQYLDPNPEPPPGRFDDDN